MRKNTKGMSLHCLVVVRLVRVYLAATSSFRKSFFPLFFSFPEGPNNWHPATFFTIASRLMLFICRPVAIFTYRLVRTRVPASGFKKHDSQVKHVSRIGCPMYVTKVWNIPTFRDQLRIPNRLNVNRALRPQGTGSSPPLSGPIPQCL